MPQPAKARIVSQEPTKPRTLTGPAPTPRRVIVNVAQGLGLPQAVNVEAEQGRHVRDLAARVVREHGAIVRRIAWEVARRTSSTLSIDDLVQVGLLALVEASRSVDLSETHAARAYFIMRVRGSMLDQLRRETIQPRSAFRSARALKDARSRVEAASGRAATNADLAEAMGLSATALRVAQDNAQSLQFTSIEQDFENDGDELTSDYPDSFDMLSHHRKWADIADAIALLPERERIAMKFFTEEMSLRNISELLGVTEGRACQIKQAALIRLRASLSGWGHA